MIYLFLIQFSMVPTDPIKFDNKPCDFKKIKENIQIGFENLKCTQPNCNKTAKIYTMDSDDNPARLY